VSPLVDDFVDRCLRLQPEERWTSVDAMLDTFRSVRRAQINFTPTLVSALVRPSIEDWSTQAVRLLERGDYRDAERVARAEFESSTDEQAFLIMIQSSYREGRYFDCIRDFEARPDVLDLPTRVVLNCVG
jgi:serine/threonine-protein kinase